MLEVCDELKGTYNDKNLLLENLVKYKTEVDAVFHIVQVKNNTLIGISSDMAVLYINLHNKWFFQTLINK